MGNSPVDAVIVITGASSGIGRATAEAFARQRANLVLASRRQDALEQVADECRRLGGHPLVVATDVTDEGQVQHLADRATDEFGRIDMWVNNAAVGLFARFEQCPMDEIRQVVNTNLMGYLHGARAAMPVFRRQAQGVLVNVSSVVASAPQPYASAYCLSKAAIRSFSNCLRMELALDSDHDIHVCTVMPAAIDTPFFQHAANHTGKAVKALNPVYPPEQVADAIVRLYREPEREVIVGTAGRWFHALSTLIPELYERMAARLVERSQFRDRPARQSQGILFTPSDEGSLQTGGWQEFSAQQKGGTDWVVNAGIVAGAATLLYAVWQSRETGSRGHF